LKAIESFECSNAITLVIGISVLLSLTETASEHVVSDQVTVLALER